MWKLGNRIWELALSVINQWKSQVLALQPDYRVSSLSCTPHPPSPPSCTGTPTEDFYWLPAATLPVPAFLHTPTENFCDSKLIEVFRLIGVQSWLQDLSPQPLTFLFSSKSPQAATSHAQAKKQALHSGPMMSGLLVA